jgi:hypothetical protein
MANTESKPMHDDFPRWHKAIGLGDDPARLQARWAGVSALADAADSKDIEALIRLAFKSRQPAPASELEKIRQAFKTTDAAFEMQGNDREMQILAGAALEARMSRGDTVGAEAALGIATAALGGARKPDLPIDLRVLGEAAIDRIADANRARPKLAVYMSTDAPKFDFEKAAAKVREQQNWEGVIAAFGLAAEGARNGFIGIARQQANAVRAIDSFIKVQDEELQMLWWLTGQRSEELDCAFDAVPANAQALVFAKELADHTEFLPGPASIKGLLSRAGLKNRKKVGIPAAINAADPEWLRGFVSDEEPSPVTTPIHYAVKRKLETGENEAWVAGWAAAAEVPPTMTLSPLTIGVLFYRERLLLLFGTE